MKLTQIPDDFHVEEITTAAASDGPFAFYRLEKINWTTPDALNLVRQRWKIPLSRISYGGLKDRHARTIQYLTIFHGAQRNFTHPGVSVEYLGQRGEAFTSTDIELNRFRLTLRSMSPKAVQHAQGSLGELSRLGVPNYFDDQRFGSVSADGRFVAKEMVLGRYEQALKAALMAPYEHDRAAGKQEKATLKQYWGDWARLKSEHLRGDAHGPLAHLARHPGDFRGALDRLKPELKALYLSTWQSHLWNKMLAHWLREHVAPGQLLSIRSRLGDLPVPRNMRPDSLNEWRTLHLPLPSSRLKMDLAASWASCVADVMEEEGVPLEAMKLKDFRKPFFSKGDRAAAVIPVGLTAEAAEDELNSGKLKLLLRFDLPRGCYATMIVKRLTQMKDAV